jgi:carbamate kinase
MRVVAALGGNALLRAGEPLDAEHQRAAVARAARALAGIARKHDLVVTHGNGPQVGWLALQSGGGLPLDVLGAESEGMIGYWIEQELGNLLPGRDVATLLTQVEVAADDRAFARPTKPIGPVYPEAEARRLAAERGWRVAPDRGGFRRVVPSPEPRAIRELHTIEILVKLGVLVVCSGGGGIPVVADARGVLRGVEAVIDKDLSAELLAARLGADALLLLTDVPGIYLDWPEPARRRIRALPPRFLDGLHLDPGTMGPKARAAHRFAVTRGRFAAIGALEDAERLLRREAGTVVCSDVPRLEVEEP